jgi:hypothetical protein
VFTATRRARGDHDTGNQLKGKYCGTMWTERRMLSDGSYLECKNIIIVEARKAIT